MLLSEQSSQKGKLTALPDILPGEFVSALAIPPNLRQFVRSRAEQGSRQFIPQARTPQKTARIATLTLEQISFLKGRTVLDNVTHPYELAGLHCQIANRLADQLLRQLGLPSGSSKLLAEFKPPFPRPRNLGLLEESEFAALKARLSASLFLTNAAFEPEYFI